MRLRLDCLFRRLLDSLIDLGQPLCSDPVGEKAVIADHPKVFVGNVHQEAADKLFSR